MLAMISLIARVCRTGSDFVGQPDIGQCMVKVAKIRNRSSTEGLRFCSSFRTL